VLLLLLLVLLLGWRISFVRGEDQRLQQQLLMLLLVLPVTL
jgi:hypothetical protein